MLGDYDTARNKFIVRSGGSFGFGPTVPGGLLAPSATPSIQDSETLSASLTSGKEAVLSDDRNSPVEPFGRVVIDV